MPASRASRSLHPNESPRCHDTESRIGKLDVLGPRYGTKSDFVPQFSRCPSGWLYYFFKNVPLSKSSKAVRSSCWVFITIGPYQATGSCSGLPDTRRKRIPFSPACTSTSSPRSKTTSERLSASEGGAVSNHLTPSVGTASGPDARYRTSRLPRIRKRRHAWWFRWAAAFSSARRYRHIDVNGICSNAIHWTAFAPKTAANQTDFRYRHRPLFPGCRPN